MKKWGLHTCHLRFFAVLAVPNFLVRTQVEERNESENGIPNKGLWLTETKATSVV